MGGSSWSHDAADYVKSARVNVPVDDIFPNNHTGVVDPLVNPFGVAMRESRDSTTHPNSNAIIVSFDVTGSMGGLPVLFAKDKLPQLMKILLAKNTIEDPQVLFIAQADAHGDHNPLQIGQFESGNEMDMWLTKFALGGGGRPDRESYDLVLYWAAKHTSIDCFEKRGKKGYLFLIGDESYYDETEKKIVKAVIGDNIERDIPIEDVVAMAQEKYNVIKICVETPYFPKGMLSHWQKLLGEHAVYLDTPNIVCEFIAAQIAAYEGHDDQHISSSLSDAGLSKTDVDKVTKALIPSARSGGIVKRGTVTGDLTKSGAKGGNTRL